MEQQDEEELYPAFYYRIVNGELEARLFKDGANCPEGWYEDKFQARDAISWTETGTNSADGNGKGSTFKIEATQPDWKIQDTATTKMEVEPENLPWSPHEPATMTVEAPKPKRTRRKRITIEGKPLYGPGVLCPGRRAPAIEPIPQ